MKSIILSTGLRYAALLLLVTDLSGGSPPARAQEQESATESGAQVETVIVSARKREESIAEVPTSITAFTAETLKDYNVQSFADYATKTPNLSFTYGQGPTGFADARTVAIRGITGQNLFGTGGATGFYIDDTPVPGSVDPRVVDLASIEVLKGPQGTLFGESSLGGNVRLITHQPDLRSSGAGFTLDVGATSGGGSVDGGGNLIANMVVVPDKAAVRVVAFANHDAGWLTRTYPDDPYSPPNNPAGSSPFVSVARTSSGDQGANSSAGGSAALLVRATDQLDITLRVMLQDTKIHGFPTAFAPLPNFTVSSYVTDRAFDVQPYATDSWTLPTLDFKWNGSGYTVVWANSYFYRHTQDVEDSSYGTHQVLTDSPCPPNFYCVSGLPPQPFLWTGDRFHDQVSSELRLSFDPIHNVSGTFGLYYSNTHTRFTIPDTNATGLDTATVGPGGPPAESLCTPACPPGLIWTQTNPGTQEDKSIFGEVYWKFLPQWTLTLGGRQYWLNQTTDYTADGLLNFGPTLSDPQSNSQSGFNPKVALQMQATEEAMVYASASKGFRAGGAQANFPGCSSSIPVYDVTHIKSDTLWTYELGTKIQTQKVLISAAAYDIEWSDLQQQVALPCGFYLQVNGDKARIYGGEIEANGRVTPELQFRVGIGIEKSEITDPGNLALVAVSGPGIQPGTRVSGVPDFTAFVGGVYTHALNANTDGFVSADYSYTGNSVSLIVGGFGAVATRPGYGLANLRFGVDRGANELSLNFRNLTNVKPNLGDIGYIGYVQLNQAGSPIPQVATLQPFTTTLQFTHSF
ncbi:MAG TPA: TonB-dependent receptor [Steroidobacteraceae bacterium]|nr:TonB-dependent receptor [Steroidobacteraceae bacterium]